MRNENPSLYNAVQRRINTYFMNKQEQHIAPDCGTNLNVSMRDIARELDISHVTVSLALRDNPRISEATRLRVKQKADEMGYRSDPMLSALSRYRISSKENPRQAVLAWINPFRNPAQLRQLKEFDLYWQGAMDAAEQLGFQLEEFTVEELSLNCMDAVFKSRNIRGVVVAPVTNRALPLNWDDFPWQDYSVIRFGRSEKTPSIHFVTSAQAGNTMLAFQKIREKGYKRIGFVGRADGRCMYASGYLGSQLVLPENLRLPPLLMEDADTAPFHEELNGWMKEHRPDAILASLPILPSMLEELGYDIPGDVGIATMSIHDTPINAGIDQNPTEIGATVIRTLVSLLNEQHFGIPAIRNSILVDGHWVDGSMLPDRSSKAD